MNFDKLCDRMKIIHGNLNKHMKHSADPTFAVVPMSADEPELSVRLELEKDTDLGPEKRSWAEGVVGAEYSQVSEGDDRDYLHLILEDRT